MNPTSNSFKSLLSWLDPDAEVAGRKYIIIHSGLVRIFVSKGFTDAENLADRTVDRVITRLPDIRENYVGEPAKYFRGVARNIMLEAWGGQEIATDNLPEPRIRAVNAGDEFECLLWCLKGLSPEVREFILDYHVYDYEGHEKIKHHRCMAEERDVKETTLRVQAHRLRVALENCVRQRVEGLRVKQNTSPEALSERHDAVKFSRER